MGAHSQCGGAAAEAGLLAHLVESGDTALANLRGSFVFPVRPRQPRYRTSCDLASAILHGKLFYWFL